MKNIIIILALLLACNSALAQTGSQKSAAALSTEVNELLLTNGQNEINAYSLRQVELDIIASTIGAGGFPLVVGSTQLLGATQGYVLYDNNGTLGNLSATTTINSIPCILGSACTIPATLSIGTSPIVGGTTGYVLYDQNGVVGGIPTTGAGDIVLSNGATLTSPIIATSFTATGLVTNADLVNPATTPNGVTCTLGATCKIPVISQQISSTYNLTTASGTQTVSGFGFTPSSCDGFGTVDGTATLTYTTFNGHSDSALDNSSIYAGGAAYEFSASEFFIAQDSGGSNNQQGSITAYNSGSITITWAKTGTPSGTFAFSIRCFQ